MPKKDHILNLPGLTIKKVSGGNPVIIEAYYRRKVRCIHCGNKHLRKKASFIRRIKHESIGLRQSILQIKAHKFYCAVCQKYFNQRFPGVLKHQRATEKLREQVAHAHTQGISQQDLSKNFRLGKATVERWYQHYYLRLNQEMKGRPCPQVLGIDEHFFNKKEGYVTTFCNLRKHKIFDVVKGRSEAALTAYLKQLPGKDKVKIICIDLSSSYRKILRKFFPNAKIVADRFHVIRMMNQHVLQLYQQLDSNLKYHRGLLGALRSKPENLSSQQLIRRNQYFAQHPIIEAVYQFKQRLHQLLSYKHCRAKKCRRLIAILLGRIKQLKASGFQPLQTLGNTLYRWREEIVRMWRFTKNNGITEGFHRKMKLIQRRAYGFRNFENYRLRVRVLCGG